MMLLNTTVVITPSKLINISLNERFGICYPLPGLLASYVCIVHDSRLQECWVCSLRALGGFYIWNASSLRIIFLKKEIRKKDCEIISCIYNIAVVDARDYIIQCLLFPNLLESC